MVAVQEVEALKPILSSLPLAVMVTDRHGAVCWTNKAFRALTGYTDEFLAQQDAGWLSNPGGASGTEILQCLGAGETFQGSVVWSCPEHGLCKIWLTVAPVRNASGDVTHGTWSVLRNGTPSTEERFSSIFASMAEGVVFQDAGGLIQECNPSAEKILGLTADQMAGLTSVDPTWAAIHEDGSPFAGEDHPAMYSLRTGQPQSNVVMGIHKPDGSLTWISIHARPLAHPGHAPYAVVTTFTDITERRQLEQEALASSERRYRKVLEQATDCVVVHDKTGKILEANQEACKALGYTREELLAIPVQELAPLAALGQDKGWWDRILSGEELKFPSEQRHKDGRMLPVEVRLSAVHLHSGPAVLVIARDTSERVRAQSALKRQVDLTERIFNSTDAHLAVVDEDGVILAVNEAWRRFGQEHLGGGEHNWGAGANYFVVCGPGTGKAAQSVFAGIRAVQLGEQAEFDAEYPCDTASETRWYGLRAVPLQGSPGTVLISHTNVTARRRAEDALRISEERHRTILHTALDGFCLSDTDGRLLEVNEAYCRMTGRSADELLRDGRDWLGNLAERADQVREEGAIRYETCSQDRDGSLIDVEVSAQYQTEGGGRIIAFLRDITDRKRAEADKAKLEARFRQAQKMESVGRLAGGIAHDFNNLLTVINGYSSLALGRLAPNNTMYSDIEEINKAGELAASLTRQLLAFSRKQMIQPVVLNLNRLIREKTPLLQRLIGEDLSISLHMEGNLGDVVADPDQIHQVLMNLVVNARDAMPHGGQLDIGTENRVLNEAEAAALDMTAMPGDYVLLTVTDNGSGMDEATRLRIFEPFFTTKEPGKGTGLGLSTVYGIVRQSNGWIDVASEPLVGTSIRIYLPRSEGTGTKETGRDATRPRNGAETILIVEDQDAVRSFTRAVLEGSGYKVLEAASGENALETAAKFPGQISLLLADVVLTGMNGKTLAEELKQVRPDMKVVFVSGYTWDLINQRGVLDHGTAFLQKPFTPDALCGKVRQMLDSST